MLRLTLFVSILMFCAPAFAQGDDFPQRLKLAEKMLEIRPAKQQLETAINAYLERAMAGASENDKEVVRSALLKIMNPKALEKITVDSYAEIFTLKELEAMVAYYNQPEARSASDKQEQLNARIAPEIVRMLDQALVRFRTETQSP
ncbi:MAG: hypothetical protein H6859_05295 [Rhodospirillales bacterium]|nr:hypothetical protein [Alphaproteobacteria bacterium]USO06576.1 MAG: hypothetical protein H6859_05295 [Rhodospirillales bacterium]